LKAYSKLLYKPLLGKKRVDSMAATSGMGTAAHWPGLWFRIIRVAFEWCVVSEVSATDRSLVQRSPTDRGGPLGAVEPWKRETW